MIRELAHFIRHAPATLALKARVPQHELYAELIARADAAGLGAKRDALIAGLHGTIVEVGAGTGAMFAHYARSAGAGSTPSSAGAVVGGAASPAIDRVFGVEPDAAFAARARQAAAALAAPPIFEVIEGSGEALPLADASVDAAVLALVLCSVTSPESVCREVARVVRPGGEVRLLEHVRSRHHLTGALMDIANPLWLRANGQGCRLNRDPLPALRAHFTITRVEPFQIWSAGIPAFPMRLIFATR